MRRVALLVLAVTLSTSWHAVQRESSFDLVCGSCQLTNQRSLAANARQSTGHRRERSLSPLFAAVCDKDSGHGPAF